MGYIVTSNFDFSFDNAQLLGISDWLRESEHPSIFWYPRVSRGSAISAMEIELQRFEPRVYAEHTIFVFAAFIFALPVLLIHHLVMAPVVHKLWVPSLPPPPSYLPRAPCPARLRRKTGS